MIVQGWMIYFIPFFVLVFSLFSTLFELSYCVTLLATSVQQKRLINVFTNHIDKYVLSRVSGIDILV